ncbi:hypothetical protein ThvES_00014540 [Thiovulum sp. ES]|jgi:hypothetical protein|nr:hypothetical protein ThvES_00014540 [Thiovulum sp. ES]
MEKIIAWGLVLTAAITLWSVTTTNHLYIG